MHTIKVKYTELLSVNIEQLFYTNKICPKYTVEPSLDFTISPTVECNGIMKRLDLVFRSNDKGGFMILGRVEGKNPDGSDILRFKPRKGDKLSFFIFLTKPDFLHFNDLPLLKNHDMFYFSNQVVDNAASRGNLHLSKDAAGVNGVNDIQKQISEIYRFQHSSEIPPAAEKVHHLLTGIEIPSKSKVNQNGKSDLIFDLSLVPPGVCQLLIENVVQDEFYYVGKNNSSRVFGTIELLLTPDITANYRIAESDGSITPSRPLFVIRFINRPTYWRYTFKIEPTSALYREMALLSASDKTDFLNRLNIVSNDSAITFQKVSSTNTDIVFVSENPIHLQEKYLSTSSIPPQNLSLTLKKYIGNAAKETSVKSGLPYPSTSSINTVTPPIIYSDTFITI